MHWVGCWAPWSTRKKFLNGRNRLRRCVVVANRRVRSYERCDTLGFSERLRRRTPFSLSQTSQDWHSLVQPKVGARQRTMGFLGGFNFMSIAVIVVEEKIIVFWVLLSGPRAVVSRSFFATNRGHIRALNEWIVVAGRWSRHLPYKSQELVQKGTQRVCDAVNVM